jgi:hypothetical protein
MAKLESQERVRFLNERFEEQRHLLRKSIKEFESGDLSEGIRIAIAIRVLVHETGPSKPLLAQLTHNYLQLEILDRKPKPIAAGPPGTRAAVVMSVPINVTISDRGVFFNSQLSGETYVPSVLGRWWTRNCLVLPGLGGFTRKEIILGLANKEGGAHVDVNLPRRYRQLLASRQLQIGWNNEGVSPLNLSRFMTAQAAAELLDSLDKNFLVATEQIGTKSAARNDVLTGGA